MKTKKAIFETKAVKDGDTVRIAITKQIRDRDGEIVMVNGVDLSEFRQAPMMMWNHRDFNPDVADVMGNVLNLRFENDDAGIPMITGEAVFANHPNAQYVKQMVLDGILSHVSVGYISISKDEEEMKVEKWKLYEVSWTPFPSNLGAKVQKSIFNNDSNDLINEGINELNEITSKKLLNYNSIHPIVKQYRNLFMDSKVFEKFGIEKTGDELVDMKNIFDVLFITAQSNVVKMANPLTTQSNGVNRQAVDSKQYVSLTNILTNLK